MTSKISWLLIWTSQAGSLLVGSLGSGFIKGEICFLWSRVDQVALVIKNPLPL